ncbi:MAG: hypothetical protein IJ555_10390 [Ruminococcus sp.]|nr:hypothetical protein [Ruminococcus sp.]
MFGSFKRMKNSIGRVDLSEMQEKHDREPKGDKKFILAVSIISIFALVTIIRAFYDPVTQTQIKNLKVSLFDILSFSAAVIAYFVLKKRGRK